MTPESKAEATTEMSELKRWGMRQGNSATHMTPRADGNWIRHADHVAQSAALVEDVARLRAELVLAKVRGRCIWSYETPKEYRGRNRGKSAYEGGFERSFRGWKDTGNPYTAEPHYSAWQVGMRHGDASARALANNEIRRAVRAALAPQTPEGGKP